MTQHVSTPRLRPVIRVFVSSTFSDMKHERNALEVEVFPKLEQLCQSHGFQFQAIDLRWGVSTEAGLDHRTMRICFDELRRAQEISPKPNFLILLGNRYGWRPLPEEISVEEFHALENAATQIPDSADKSAVAVLREWYRKDTNAVPPVYLLQSRRQDLGDGQDYTHDAAWNRVQAVLWTIINRAMPPELLQRRFDAVAPDGSPPAINRFQASATEQEIWHGALLVPDARDHVLAFFREIENLAAFSDPKQIKDFVDVGPSDSVEVALHTEQDRLKAELRQRLGSENVFRNEAPTRLVEAQGHQGGRTADVTTGHLAQFCAKVVSRLSEIIQGQIEEYWRYTAPVSTDRAARELEIEQHEYERFARERGGEESFVGRQVELQAILDYVGSNSRWPLVINGASGCGKTALLARASQEVAKTRKRIERFIGVAPRSSDLRSLLSSLCQELRQRNPREDPLPTEIKKLSDEFYQHLQAATPEQPMILFLDALDQLADVDNGRLLNWLPPGSLPAHVKLVVSCLSDRATDDPTGQPLAELNRRPIPAENFINLDVLTEAEARLLLFDRWLPKAGRKVTGDQRAHIEQRLASPACRQPIFLKLLFEEALLWHSYDPAPVPGESVHALLGQLFDRLCQPTNHGLLLVNRVLCYLSASRHGLAENEIQEILFADPEYRAKLNETTEQTRQELPPNAKRIPIALWSRLRFDLAPYLTERTAPGANVLTFYHWQVAEWVQEHFTAMPDQSWQPHRLLATYFRQKADPLHDEMWRGDHVRGLAELPYHQTKGQLWKELENTLCNVEFVSAASKASLVDDLISNLDVALHTALADQAESRRSLEEMREFVIREAHFLRRFARTPGFVRQHACNKGLSHARNLGPDGPWFRKVRSTEASGPLLSVLGQHGGNVTECAVSAKAGVVISTSLDQSVRRWEIDTRRQNEIISYLPKGGTSCDVSIDGLTVVSGCLDGHVRIHRGGETILCEGRFKSYPSRCRLFAGEERILSIGNSGTLMVHDVASGKLLTQLSLDSDLHACSFSPNGKAALACQNGNILIYDPVANRITHTIQACARTFACAFSPDGRYLVAVGGLDLYVMDVKPYGEVVLFEAPDWHKIALSEQKWPELATGCSFLQDGHRFAVAFNDGLIRIFDALDPGLAVSIKAHSAFIRSLVSFKSCGGECLLTASADSEIRVWNIGLLTTDTERARPSGRAVFCAFANNTPQTWVWFANVRGFKTTFTAAEYDFTPQSVSPPLVADLPPEYFGRREFGIFNHDLAPDVRKDIATISGWRKGSRNVHRSSPFSDWGTYWIVAASARLKEHAFHLVPNLPDSYFRLGNLTWARSVGSQIAILRHNQLQILPPEYTHAVSASMQFTHRPYSEQPQCIYARDGARIYIGYANELRVVEATTGNPIASCNLEEDEVACISESEEGDSLCVGCTSGILVEWNWQTGRQTTYAAHSQGVTDCSYASRDHLLSIGRDGAICLWKRGVQEPLAVFPAAASLSAFALSPVDNRIVIADVHGEVVFLFLESIAEEAKKQSVLPPSLPAARELLHSLLQSDSIVEYLALEFANISSPEYLFIAYSMMAHLFEVTDRAIADDLRCAASRSKSTVDVLAAAAGVERKVFGPSETIIQVSQVIRGIARILNATRASDLDYALDVGKRFAWPRTRMILLLAVYGSAEAKNRREILQAIAPMLGGA